MALSENVVYPNIASSIGIMMINYQMLGYNLFLDKLILLKIQWWSIDRIHRPLLLGSQSHKRGSGCETQDTVVIHRHEYHIQLYSGYHQRILYLGYDISNRTGGC